MRQISRRMEMIHPTIGWRRDEHGTHKHAHGSWILWSVSRVRSKTMHSLSCITSWLPYITLRNNDSRFFLPLEQSRTALLGCSLAIKEKKKKQGSLRAISPFSSSGEWNEPRGNARASERASERRIRMRHSGYFSRLPQMESWRAG